MTHSCTFARHFCTRNNTCSLGVVAEAIEVALVVAPVLFDLDEGGEHDLLAEEGLDVLACQHAEPTQHGTFVTNEDALLAFAFAIDDGRNVDDVVALLEALDADLAGIGNLLVVEQQDLLADDFGDEEPGGLVGQGILLEIGRTLGQQLFDLGHQQIGTQTMQGGNGYDFGVGQTLMPLFDKPDECGLIDEVHLVQDHDDTRLRRGGVVGLSGHGLHLLEELLVLLGTLDRVGEIQEDISVNEGALAERQHRLVELGDGLEHAGRIAEYDLHVVGVDDAHYAMARGLCLAGDDADAFADEGIHQGALADVGGAYDVDHAGLVGWSHGGRVKRG